MKRLLVAPAILWGLAALFGAICFAELSADKTKEAQALIAQFGAAEFPVRQAAVDKLIDMGPDVIALIKKTLADSNDAEVKLRCNMVLKGITARFGVAPDGTITKGPVFAPSLITLDDRQAPLSEVLQRLADLSGNSLVSLKEAGDIGDKIVTITAKNMPYWEVLDTVCRQADACYYFEQNDEDKFRVCLRPVKNKNPEMFAYAGPVAVKLDHIQSSQSATSWTLYRTSQHNIKDPVQRGAGLNCQLSFFVEDRLPVLASWLEFTKAVTPDGVDHVDPWMRQNRAEYRQEMRGNADNMEWPLAGSANFSFSSRPGEAKLDKPMTLSGNACLEVVYGLSTVKIEKLDLDGNPGEKAVTGNGVDLLLKKLEHKGGQVIATIEVVADAGVPIFTGGTEAKFGFALVDSKGKACKDISRFDWKTKNNNASGGGDRMGIRLNDWSEGNKSLEGTLTLTFNGVRAAEGDWSIVLTYPDRCEVKEFPFTIKDIPLP